ncbi:MAG TPA: hypothetical protein VG755_07855, partial [Nannocystaceae bacterium]|nr:hypothetical protein [Nannocystaceae bacterium]
WIRNDERVTAALQAIGQRSPRQLAGARRWLHFALQPIAAHGFSTVTATDDYRHTAGHWVRERRAIVGEASSSTPSFRAGLELATGALVLIDARDEVRERHVPTGGTLDDAYRWYDDAATRLRGGAQAVVRPGHQLPGDPLGAGARFGALDVASAEELAAWFELADAALDCVAAHVPGASTRRVWPHHFDLATLVDLGEGRSIGIGLSPGDDSYDEPYFYATPWPYPAADVALARLPDGAHWHREGWTGAVLVGSALIAGDRAALLDAWLRSSYATLRTLLAR